MYDTLDSINLNPLLNDLVKDVSAYAIMQDVPVDNKQHTLTIRLDNGNTSVYTSRTLRVYKLVISELE